MEGRCILMNINSGKILAAQKVVIYGPEGIGKSSFAAQFPGALFIDTEGSTKKLDVRRFDKPSSWQMLLEQVKYVKYNPSLCQTLVIDTADWAETLCAEHICAKYKVESLASIGYGNGYVYLKDEFGRLLNMLEEIIDLGINVVITAHAQINKFEQPDEMGAYDRWEMKLSKKVAPLVKEWADMVLFANYKTYVSKTENKTVKATGGARVMYSTHHTCWDAKNRDGLRDEMPLDFASIAHIIPAAAVTDVPVPTPETPRVVESTKESVTATTTNIVQETTMTEVSTSPSEVPTPPKNELHSCFASLRDLMNGGNVTDKELQEVVWERGYYPLDTPIEQYDPEFVSGVLIGAWDQVCLMIATNRKVPF